MVHINSFFMMLHINVITDNLDRNDYSWVVDFDK